jgi:hypothetical protein
MQDADKSPGENKSQANGPQKDNPLFPAVSLAALAGQQVKSLPLFVFFKS